MAYTPWYDLAKLEIGVKEVAGTSDNPRIVEFWRMARINPGMAIHDEIAWCSVFACAMMESAGQRSPRSAWARDWLKWGTPLSMPVLGCVVVLDRGQGYGHVGFYAGYENGRVLLLGGNQGDQVKMAWFSKDLVLGFRMPTPEAPPAPEPEPIPVMPVVTHEDEEQRLREEGSRTIENADKSESKAKQIVGWSFAGGIFESLRQLGDTFTSLGPITHKIPNLGPLFWGVVVSLAILIAYEQGYIRFARTDDSLKGKNKSR